MNDMDLEQLLAMTAHCRTENAVLWNAAIGHLKSPNFSVVINYIVERVSFFNTTLNNKLLKCLSRPLESEILKY